MISIKNLGTNFKIGEFKSPIYKTNTKTTKIDFAFDKEYKSEINPGTEIYASIVLTVLLNNGTNRSIEKPITIDNNKSEIISFDEVSGASHFRYQLFLASNDHNSIIIKNIKINCYGITLSKNNYQEGLLSFVLDNNVTSSDGTEHSLSNLSRIYYNGSEDQYNHIFITSKVYDSSKTTHIRESAPHKRKEINNVLQSYKRISLKNLTKEDITNIPEGESYTEKTYSLALSPKEFVKNKNDNENIQALNKRILFNVYIPGSKTVNENGLPIQDNISSPLALSDGNSKWITTKDIMVLYKDYNYSNIDNYYTGNYIKIEVKNGRTYIFPRTGLYEISSGSKMEDIELKITIKRTRNEDISPCIDFIAIQNDNYYEETIKVGKGQSIECEVNGFIDYVQTNNGRKPIFTKTSIINGKEVKQSFYFDLANVGFKLPYWYSFDTINNAVRNPFSITISQDFKLKHPNIKIWINHSINSGNLVVKGSEINGYNDGKVDYHFTGENLDDVKAGKAELSPDDSIWIRGSLIGVIEPYVAIEYDLTTYDFIYPASTKTRDDDSDKLLKSRFFINTPFDEDLSREYIYQIKFADTVYNNKVKFMLYQKSMNGSDELLYIDSEDITNNTFLTYGLEAPFSLTIKNPDEVEYELRDYVVISKGFVGTLNNGNTQEDYYRVFNIIDIPAYEEGLKNLEVKAEDENIKMSWSASNLNDEVVIQTDDADVSTIEYVDGIVDLHILNQDIRISGEQKTSLFIPYTRLTSLTQAEINKDSIFKIASSELNIEFAIENAEDGIYILAKQKHDLRKEWLPTIKNGGYNLEDHFYYYNPQAASYNYTDISNPLIKDLSLVNGNDGKAGLISNGKDKVIDNILSIKDNDIEYYLLEEF